MNSISVTETVEIVLQFDRNAFGVVLAVTDDELIRYEPYREVGHTEVPTDIPAIAATYRWGQRTVLVTDDGQRFVAEGNPIDWYGDPKMVPNLIRGVNFVPDYRLSDEVKYEYINGSDKEPIRPRERDLMSNERINDRFIMEHRTLGSSGRYEEYN